MSALVAVVGVVAGCSDPTSLGVINTCPFPVEVQNPELAAGGWTAIGIGERIDGIEGGSDGVDLVIRRGVDGPSMSMSVAAADIADLEPGPFGPEIILSGSTCGLLDG
ncbi:MAG: hypothetical protein AAGA17_11030 [Actinomycetota bacterium]